MSFVVLYDVNVLYPSTLRDLLIRVAQAGLVQAKWTDQILDEVFGNLATNRPDLDPARLARTRELMNRAVRDCLVTGYEPLVDALDLPDPDDRHVLAAAIKARAQVIVTHNLKDFPSTVLEEWDVEAKSADDFILDQIDLSHDSVYGRCSGSRTPEGILRQRSQMSWQCSNVTASSSPSPLYAHDGQARRRRFGCGSMSMTLTSSCSGVRSASTAASARAMRFSSQARSWSSRRTPLSCITLVHHSIEE